MNFFKRNYKLIICFIILLVLFNIKLPYYIDTSGGIENVNNKIDIDGFKSNGSFNIVFVKEFKATIPLVIYSLFNKNYDILKLDDVILDNETDKSYKIRDKLLMDESVSNAIYVAYTKANKKIEIIDNRLVVLYNQNENSDLTVNDEIVSINDYIVNSKEEITKIIENINENDKLNIKVKNDRKTYTRYAYLTNENKIGIIVGNIKKYETNPKISIKVDKNESGPSGGLMMALAIYNSLTKDDLTRGLKIVGTGTIDDNGLVGEIGGVKYKLQGAVKEKSDLFLVPQGDNCKEAKKLKERNNYKIEIKCVSTFDEAINYLKYK